MKYLRVWENIFFNFFLNILSFKIDKIFVEIAFAWYYMFLEIFDTNLLDGYQC